MMVSVANIKRSGKRKARRRSRTVAPAKRAMAPTGVKFQGWGARQRAPARRMRVKIRRVRRRADLFSAANFFRFIFLGSFFSLTVSLTRAEARATATLASLAGTRLSAPLQLRDVDRNR